MKQKKNLEKTCYLCGAPATSVEHAPAKCFFPKDRRTNLITVDSCKEHNEDTSLDDEYVRLFIVSCIVNNNVALSHFSNKCIKTMQHSEVLTKKIASTAMPVLIREKGGTPQKGLCIEMDRSRFNKIMRKYSYGIYFHKYGKRWNRQLSVGTECLLNKDGSKDDFGLFIQDIKEVFDLSKVTFEGNEPTVFQYAFLPMTGPEGDQTLVMRFYEGFEVWCFPVPDSTENEI